MDASVAVGDALTVTVRARAEGDANAYSAATDDPRVAEGWSVVVLRRDDEPYETGTTLEAWVMAVEPERSELVVTADEFGRLPVSDRMRERYLAAIEHLLLSARGVPGDPAMVSEAKGMFGRILKRNQRDWLSVHRALGDPSRAEAEELESRLAALGRAVKARENPLPAWVAVRQAGLLERLRQADAALRA